MIRWIMKFKNVQRCECLPLSTWEVLLSNLFLLEPESWWRN